MNHRPLKKIAAEIAGLLKRETASVIKIGDLLAEAQEQLDARGQWLSWLHDNFYLSVRTAQRYLAASAFAREYDTVSHSLLSVGALYALIEADRDGYFEAVEVALREAKVQWVDDDRVREIVAAQRTPPSEEPPSDEGGDEDEPPGEVRDEALPPEEAVDEAGDKEPPAGDAPKGDKPDSAVVEPDDDRPPPTPPSSMTPKQAVQLLKFEAAIKELRGLMAKPAHEFLAAGITGFDLETVADFVQQIAREKSKIAGGDQGGVDVARAVKAG